MAAAVLVVGEALLDVVLRPDGTVLRTPGGSPANVAVGLARLGVATTLLTSYGDDEAGGLLDAHLRASGVEVVRAVAPTSTATAVLDELGRAEYEIDISWSLAGAEAPSAPVLHVGSVAATTGDDVVRLVERARGNALVSYDPNCRPQVMGAPDAVRPRVEELVSLADVVKASDEDLTWLHPGCHLDDVADQWLAAGPRLVVVTRGREGASAWTADGRRDVPVAPGGLVVDTVGAGDAFMAGLLWGLLEGDPDPVSAAAVVARRTCERAGADPPTRAQLGM